MIWEFSPPYFNARWGRCWGLLLINPQPIFVVFALPFSGLLNQSSSAFCTLVDTLEFTKEVIGTTQACRVFPKYVPDLLTIRRKFAKVGFYAFIVFGT